MINKFVGVGIDWLKHRRLIVKLAYKLRLHHPVLWAAVMRRLKPYYLNYHASLSAELHHEFLQAVGDFDDPDWHRKQTLKHLYGHFPSTSDIQNKFPSVDPSALLERINKNLDAQIR